MSLDLKAELALPVKDISEILDLTTAKIKHMLHDARKDMTQIFEQRCALINKTGACHQCTELNGIFNPRLENAQALLKVDMLTKAKGKSPEDLLNLRMKLVAGIDVFTSKGKDWHLFHMTHTKTGESVGTPRSHQGRRLRPVGEAGRCRGVEENRGRGRDREPANVEIRRDR